MLGAWERLGALAIQVALTVLVLQAFVRGRRWWWYALGAHTLVDFTTVGVMVLAGKAWGQQTGMLLTEGLVGVYAVLALWLIAALRPGQKDLAPCAAAPPAAAPSAPAERPPGEQSATTGG